VTANRKPGVRKESEFFWRAACGMPAYAVLAGVRFDRLFLDADAIVEAYRKGEPMARRLFGPDIATGGPMCAGISYGHLNVLGSELTFPEDSEVGQRPVYSSIEEGIQALQKDIDFTSSGMFPYYLDLWEDLKKAFPERNISFAGFGSEGPITSGWLLRGHDFFMDIYDKPERVKEYLLLVSESVVKYRRLFRRINGQTEFSEEGTGLVDDGSAMISPELWPEFVMPFLNHYYERQTSGKRNAHIEDLKVEHLKYLDELGLNLYDPSVSAKLMPRLIRDNCSVPFTWRLNTTHYPGMSPADIEQWVFDAAAGGASGVTTNVDRPMCTPQVAEKVKAFIAAGKKVQLLLSAGCGREELLEHLNAVDAPEVEPSSGQGTADAR